MKESERLRKENDLLQAKIQEQLRQINERLNGIKQDLK